MIFLMVDTVETKIIVIIPCRNESGRIAAVVKSIRKNLPEADILAVNDASTDDSAREAATAGDIVLSHSCNMGYGASLETGYLYAMRKDYDIVVQMDGDGQHKADQLELLLKPLLSDTADVVIGSRYGSGESTEATTFIRKAGHRLFSAIIRILTGLKLSDPTSGFQGLNRKAVSLFSSGVFPCDYPDSDVVLLAHMSGIRLVEVPVVMKGRSGGQSMHSGLKPIYYGMKMMLSIFIVLLNYRTWKSWKHLHEPNASARAVEEKL